MSKGSWFLVAAALLTVGWLSKAGLAAEKPNPPANEPVAFKYSDLKGTQIENPKGEKLGKIEDLVYDGQNGQVRYAAVSFGGFLGVGDKLFAVPWHALKPRYDSASNLLRFSMDADKASLEKAPGFDPKNWPDVGDPKWSTEVDKFYSSSTTTSTSNAASSGTGHSARASRLATMGVKNERGEDLGKIEDIVVDIGKGNLRYVALSFGGFLGLGDKLFAVPFETLRAAHDPNSTKYHLVLNVDKQTMEKAPGFDKNHWPDFGNLAWASDVERFYRRGSTERTKPGTTAFKSKDLVGMRVENEQGQDLGKINALVMELHSGKLRYAALSFGGFLGVGDMLFAVPWQALKVRYNTDKQQYHVVLNADKARLEKAPGFDSKHWPNFADREWAGNVHTFYGLQQANTESMDVRKADDVLGMKVHNPQGENVGKIDEMVVDLEGGAVRYAALSFGGFLGIGDKVFAVPWRQIQFRNDPKSREFVAVVNVDKKALEKAPSFDKNHWPDFADPNWSRDIDAHYGTQASQTSTKR